MDPGPQLARGPYFGHPCIKATRKTTVALLWQRYLLLGTTAWTKEGGDT